MGEDVEEKLSFSDFSLSCESFKDLVVREFLIKSRKILEIKSKSLWVKYFDNFALGELCCCSQKGTESII